MAHVTQNWRVEKPTAVSRGGIVVAQYRAAAEVGAAMLRAGGNAVDAALGAMLAALSLYRRLGKPHPELLRKLLHVGMGLTTLLFPWLFADAWPVLGADAAASALATEVAKLSAGTGLAIVGPRRSGRSTLAHRLSWTLGVSGAPVASIEAASDASIDVVELELDAWISPAGKLTDGLTLVIDDLESLSPEGRARSSSAMRSMRSPSAASMTDGGFVSGMASCVWALRRSPL